MEFGRIFASAVVRKVAYVLVGAFFALIAARCQASVCVEVDGAGFLVESGTLPPCASLVLMTESEVGALQSIFTTLSIADGTAIGTSIFLAWAIAFGLRCIRRIVERDADTDGG